MRPLAPAAPGVFAACLLLVAFTAQAPVPTPQPAPVPPTAAPSPPAAPTPSPQAVPTPVVVPSATTTPSASPYRFVVSPPPPPAGEPAILEIDLLDQTLHPGAPYSLRIKTTPDVTSMTVSTMGQTFTVPGAGPGLFASDGTVPSGIPFFFLNRAYTLNVTAYTADHRKTSTPVTIRLDH